MRTSITFDGETLEYVTAYASARGVSLSRAVRELIREARAKQPEASEQICRTAEGFPTFPPTGRSITPAEVNTIEEEAFDPGDAA